MFVVIFLEQWKKDERHLPALLGIGLSALCLVIFGSDGFIVPSMLVLLIALTLLGRSEIKDDVKKAGAVMACGNTLNKGSGQTDSPSPTIQSISTDSPGSTIQSVSTDNTIPTSGCDKKGGRK